MAKRGSKSKRPNSTCLAFIGWQATAQSITSGKREVTERNLGVVTIIFRRQYPKYRYVCTRKQLTYGEYLAWAKSPSPGSVWNYMYKGKI